MLGGWRLLSQGQGCLRSHPLGPATYPPFPTGLWSGCSGTFRGLGWSRAWAGFVAPDMAGVWTSPSCPHPYLASRGPPRHPPHFRRVLGCTSRVSQSVKSAPSSEGGCGPGDGGWGSPCAPAPQDWSGSQRQPPALTCTCHRILWVHQSPSSTEMPTSSSSASRSCPTRLSSVMDTTMDSQARLSQGGLWDVKSTGPEDGGRGIRLLILYTVFGSVVFFFFFKWSVTRFH